MNTIENLEKEQIKVSKYHKVSGVIAYCRVFAAIAGSVQGGLFLSQADYWSQRINNDDEGWFSRTQKEWEEKTGLTRYELEKVASHLKGMGVIEIKKQGCPAVNHYRVVYSVLDECVEQYKAGNFVGDRPRNTRRKSKKVELPVVEVVEGEQENKEDVKTTISHVTAIVPRVNEERYSKKVQPGTERNIDGSEKFPWALVGVRGKFDPQFEEWMCKRLSATSFYKKLSVGAAILQVRKHISDARYDNQRRDQLFIEWEAMQQQSQPQETKHEVMEIPPEVAQMSVKEVQKKTRDRRNDKTLRQEGQNTRDAPKDRRTDTRISRRKRNGCKRNSI